MTAKAIASQYDVARITSYAVLQGKTCRHVPDPDGPVVMRRVGRPLMNPNGEHRDETDRGLGPV
jgi:hypothetical protein